VTWAVRGFAPRVSEVSAARCFARSVVSGWGLRAEEVVLVVDELASNAVCHAHTRFKVALCRREDGAVVVEVTDGSPVVPSVHRPSFEAVGGRGTLIVERLTRAWGSRPLPAGGKTVWAVMARQPRVGGDSRECL
jgi:anti-sigma regulatory factor (Ser/Thr protein kinase)